MLHTISKLKVNDRLQRENKIMSLYYVLSYLTDLRVLLQITEWNFIKAF